MTTKEDLLLFFDRPQEPCFMQKGDKNTVIQIPEHYYPDKYKTVTSTLENRFGESAGRTLQVSNIAIPDLTVPMQLPYNGQFSLFVNHHRTVAGHLIDIFLNMRNLEDLMSLCSYCQLRVNPYLFNYALSVAILHRPDTKGLNIPNFAEVFPDKFVDPKVINKAREVTNLEPMGDRMPIIVPKNYTAADTDLEQRLAYFREDIGINLHHWHWHLVYPFESANESIVNKDRRGELFYYMHQQIIARYNTERMCNGVDRVKRLNNFREPIVEAYFPKMESQVASRAWPPRFAGSYLRDLNRASDQVRAEIIDLENSRDRFLQAIDKMAIQLPNGRDLPLDETTGIDILGNLMESSSLSRNRPFYGNMHNLGHIFIAYCHDPDHKYLEQFGVMGDSGTAMRDPVFYRWHSFIDDIFQLFKAKLPPYNNTQLDFNGIRVSSVGIEGSAGPNTISTFWEQSTVNLGRGLDFMPRGSVLATFTHLQHTDFTYVLDVNNTTGQNVMGTVRIFIAPTRDDAGQPLPFEEQRKLMIELDKFTQALRPGNNKIRQRSTNSSVTIPYERTFRDQGARVGTPGSEQAADFDFCGCGWPHHMLTPKGTTSGFPMVLFAMVSNWNDDRIDQDLVGACNDASSYCGIRDRKYPDKRAMGFPFDRRSDNAFMLSDFLKPNMATSDCTIRFSDTTRQRGQQA